MNLLLDTADIGFIETTTACYTIAGVTTNPTILSRQNKNCLTLLKDIQAVIGKDSELHAQVIATDTQTMIREALYLTDVFQGCIYAKIPVTPQGYQAMKALAPQGVKITATAVFTAQQALMAAKSGASYVAPYVNRIDDIGGNGAAVVAAIASIFKAYALSTKILAASFKNTEQIQQVCLAGAHAATVSQNAFENLYTHPLTDRSVQKFSADWQQAFGHKNMCDFS